MLNGILQLKSGCDWKLEVLFRYLDYRAVKTKRNLKITEKHKQDNFDGPHVWTQNRITFSVFARCDPVITKFEIILLLQTVSNSGWSD